MARYRTGQGKLFRKQKNGEPVGNWFFKYQGKETNTLTKDKDEAERFRVKYAAQALDGVGVSRLVKVGELMALHLEEYETKGRGSIAALKSRQKKLSFFEKLDAQTLTSAHLRRYVEARKRWTPRPSNPTIDRELEALRRALNIGKEEELITRVPSFKSVISGEDNVRTGFIEPDDYERLRDALREPERLMFVMLYHMGWRVGRVLGLTWDKVHLDGNDRYIDPPEKQYNNKKIGPAPIYWDLDRALRVAAIERERDHPECPWVIHRANGGRVVDYRDAWGTGTAAAGLDGLDVHDLRRTALRNLLNAGFPVTRISKITKMSIANILRYDIVVGTDVSRMARELDSQRAEDKAKSNDGAHFERTPANGVN